MEPHHLHHGVSGNAVRSQCPAFIALVLQSIQYKTLFAQFTHFSMRAKNGCHKNFQKVLSLNSPAYKDLSGTNLLGDHRNSFTLVRAARQDSGKTASQVRRLRYATHHMPRCCLLGYNKHETLIASGAARVLLTGVRLFCAQFASLLL